MEVIDLYSSTYLLIRWKTDEPPPPTAQTTKTETRKVPNKYPAARENEILWENLVCHHVPVFCPLWWVIILHSFSRYLLPCGRDDSAFHPVSKLGKIVVKYSQLPTSKQFFHGNHTSKAWICRTCQLATPKGAISSFKNIADTVFNHCFFFSLTANTKQTLFTQV